MRRRIVAVASCQGAKGKPVVALVAASEVLAEWAVCRCSLWVRRGSTVRLSVVAVASRESPRRVRVRWVLPLRAWKPAPSGRSRRCERGRLRVAFVSGRVTGVGRTSTLSLMLSRRWEVNVCAWRTLQLMPDRALRPQATSSPLSDGTLEAREGGAYVLVFIADGKKLFVQVIVHLLVGVVHLLGGTSSTETGVGEPP